MNGYAQVAQLRQVVNMAKRSNEKLKRFGFAFPFGSPHVSRTMMLAELTGLIEFVADSEAPKDRYIKAIVEENCLAKRTEKNRQITKRYLVELYTLDVRLLVFRALLIFWYRDKKAWPLLALLCAYIRDPLLQDSSEFILPLCENTSVSREDMETYMDDKHPGRYSPKKLASNAKNLNSTWTQSGHLHGRVKKIRSRAEPTAGSVSYALLLGYVTGVRGESLFRTRYIKLLDCSFERAIELAEEASRKGWIVFKRVGDVMEVLFPNLLSAQEMEWIREQN